MNVIFDAETKNRFTMQVDGYGTLYFKKGTYITQDKELIRKLINHPLYKRDEYKMVSNDDTVAQYLEGEEPDELTEEILDNISRQGIIELGEEVGTRQSQPTLIKIELVGEPITNKIKEILDFYRMDKKKKEVKEEIQSDSKVETITNNISTDMKAKEAISFIEETPTEDLEGFVPEDEDRVTVTRAYNEKMNE